MNFLYLKSLWLVSSPVKAHCPFKSKDLHSDALVCSLTPCFFMFYVFFIEMLTTWLRGGMHTAEFLKIWYFGKIETEFKNTLPVYQVPMGSNREK